MAMLTRQVFRCSTYACLNGVRVRTLAYFVYHDTLEVPKEYTPAKLAGRQWLTGATSQNNNFPEYLAHPKRYFPPVFAAANTKNGTNVFIKEWSSEVKLVIDHELHKHGMVLFKNLPLYGVDDFSKFMTSLGFKFMSYEGGTSFRQLLKHGVFTTDDDVADVGYEPHNEMAYARHYPNKIFFFCDVPPGPGCGGETAIADVRDIQQRLQPDVLEKFDRLGVMYHRHLPFGANNMVDTWQKVFFTESKKEVERHLQNTNSDYRWNADDSLSFWHVKPAFTKHPNSGDKIWFNQITLHHGSYYTYHPRWAGVRRPGHEYPSNTYYGDGTEIDIAIIEHIRDVIWQVAVGYQPQRGDLLVLDNLHIQHTRLGFTGPRKLYVSMTVD